MGAVLAMYDVRGIQEFIFRSNRIKEIVGASHIVDTLLEDFFKGEFDCAQKESPDRLYLYNWYTRTMDGLRTPGAYRFDDDPNVAAEVLNFGGGNMLVAFRDANFAKALNRRLSAYIIQHTYSLSVAVAMVEKGGNYQEDYRKLKEVMARVKQENISTRPFGGFPFTRHEVTTGFPVAAEIRNHGDIVDVSSETLYKLKAYSAKHEIERMQPEQFEINMEKIIDSRTRENMVALVHIDGNDIGRKLTDVLSKQKSYKDAVETLRTISVNLHNCFCVKGMEVMKGLLRETVGSMQEKKNTLALRPIVLAGDDVTFICCAPHALMLTRAYLGEIERYMLIETPEAERLSACAGICYIHPHFPFRVAYELTEELCASAKEARRKARARESYLDFHTVESGLLSDLETLRQMEYHPFGKYQLLNRPYTLEGVDKLIGTVSAYREKEIPRSWLKRARDAYHSGEAEINLLFAEASSRGHEMDLYKTGAITGGAAQYYDALEMLDLIAAGLEVAPDEEN